MLAQGRGRWAVSQSAFSKLLVSAVDYNTIELRFKKYLLQGVLSNVCHFEITTVSENVFNRTQGQNVTKEMRTNTGTDRDFITCNRQITLAPSLSDDIHGRLISRSTTPLQDEHCSRTDSQSWSLPYFTPFICLSIRRTLL